LRKVAMSFIFGEEWAPEGVLQARVPRGLSTEQELFDVLYEQLHLPDYFGSNWNALEECIRDLSWLEPGMVVLIHKDVPLRKSPAALKVYLSILRGAISKWRESDERQLAVVFQEGTENEVREASVEP
jgi:hypothetical protein